MKQTVVVINPWAIDFKLYDEWMHPLGLYFLISRLKHAGVTVRFFNCLDRLPGTRNKRFSTGDYPSVEVDRPQLYDGIPRTYKRYGRPRADLIRFLKNGPAPSAVLLGSAMTYWLPGLKYTVEVVRRILPGVPVVVGGTSAMLMPKLLRREATGVSIVPGSVFDSTALNGFLEIGEATTAGWRPSLLDAYRETGRLRHGPVLATLGCPMACSYCASEALQPSFRIRDPRLVAEEVSYLAHEMGVRDFAFYDDALLYRADEGLGPLLDALRERRIRARFHLPNGLHLRWLTRSLLQRMKEAGFETLRFGYESGHHLQGDAVSHKATRRLTEQKIDLVRRAGFASTQVGVYVMGGLRGQTPGQMMEDIEFIAGLGVMVKPVFVSPVPRTALFETYAREFPALTKDPLWHNDTFFVTRLPGWGWDAAQQIHSAAQRLSRALHV